MIDLLEKPELIPEYVQAILDDFEKSIDDGKDGYKACLELEQALFKAGYTIEWGLGAEPYNLQKIPNVCMGCEEGAPVRHTSGYAEHYSFDGLPFMYCEDATIDNCYYNRNGGAA